MSQIEELLRHLKYHVKYRTSRREIVEACSSMTDIVGEDREWFLVNLPEGLYYSGEGVIATIMDNM